MYKYTISDGDYSYFSSYTFYHDIEYDNEQFKELIYTALITLKNEVASYEVDLYNLKNMMIQLFGFYEIENTASKHIHDFSVANIKSIDDLN